MTDTTERCGVADPRRPSTLCMLPAGHDKQHYDGRLMHWTGGAKPAPAPKKSAKLTDACPKCGREFGEHDGPRCPQPTKAKVSKIYTQDEVRAMEARDLATAPLAPAPKKASRKAVKVAAPPAPPTTPEDPATLSALAADVIEKLDRGDTIAPPAAPLTKIGEHDVHPAAALFPMIGEAEWPAFRDDIEANKQRKKIVRIRTATGWQILDGRNRLRACLEIGYEPEFRTFGEDSSDGDDPIAFVVSENVQRRHLNETQRAFVGAALVPMYEAEAQERKLSGRKADLTLNSGQGRAPTSAERAARAVNVGKASVEAALKVERDAAPQVLDAAKNRGQIKVSTAARLVELPKKKQIEIVEKIGGGELRSGKVRAYVKQEEKRAVVRKVNDGNVAPMPIGPFGVIYGDYPWPYENSDNHEGSRGHLGYPTMTFEQIVTHALETAKRAGSNCVVALWTTNAYVTKMERVVEGYGAEQRTVLTWPKPKFGVGGWARGQTEHVVIASIGAPVHTLNEISTLLPSWEPEHPGEHSSKPKEVAELLRKHCCGPFLELFGRGPREGWAVWGAEDQKFATEAA